jgi:hypothetical protein
MVILWIIGCNFYNIALNPHGLDGITSTEDASQVGATTQTSDVNVDWLLNKSNYIDEYIDSNDGLKLHSYKIVNKYSTDKWVIVVHGYKDSGLNVSYYARRYYNMGYNVLVPNLRGHNLSEGDYIGMGWDDRLDILSWIDYLLEENSECDIVLHGVSMGAATVSMASGEDLPENVRAIISDCGYTSVWDEFAYQLNEIFSLPEFPILYLTSFVSKIKAGYSLRDASVIEQVKKSNTPILYIHGDEDDFVPYYMMEALYDATSSDKEMLTIAGATHARAAKVNPTVYWNNVFKFISKYLD